MYVLLYLWTISQVFDANDISKERIRSKGGGRNQMSRLYLVVVLALYMYLLLLISVIICWLLQCYCYCSFWMLVTSFLITCHISTLSYSIFHKYFDLLHLSRGSFKNTLHLHEVGVRCTLYPPQIPLGALLLFPYPRNSWWKNLLQHLLVWHCNSLCD